MADPITVSQLAERVVTSGLELPLVLRRLRHWTMTGVLPPIGGTTTGPGRARHYDPGVVYLAATLNELADMGLPLGILKTVSRFVQKLERGRDAKAKKRWRDAIDGRDQVYAWVSAKVTEAAADDPSQETHTWFGLDTADEIVANGGRIAAAGGVAPKHVAIVDLTGSFERLRR